MSYTSWSVVFGEQPSAAKWNILGTNDASFNDGTGIATSAITPEKLLTGTGTSWAWQSYTPTWTGSSSNPAIGNGTISGKYVQIGKTVLFKVSIITGSTTTFGSGAYRVSFPVTPTATLGGVDLVPIGLLTATRQTVANYTGAIFMRASVTTYFSLGANAQTGGFTAFNDITNTVPSTWATGDEFRFTGCYEAA